MVTVFFHDWLTHRTIGKRLLRPLMESEALPLVTVITPSFNQARFIRATIESVLSQDYPNIEYIIVDGGSTDGTSGVVAPYSNRLTFISEKDRGQADAINKGLRMASGSIVAYLNSDDLFLPGAVSAAVAALAANPELGAVYGEGYRIDADGNVIARFEVTEEFNLWKLVNVSDYILQQTVFWRRSVFDTIGFFDLDLHYGLDWEILMRTGKRYVMEYIPQFMGCLREYPEAKTSAGGAQRFREIARILRAHSSYRFPPAYFIYGLDTYEKIACRRISSLFGWWPRLARKLQRGVLRRVAPVDRTSRHAFARALFRRLGLDARALHAPARRRTLHRTDGNVAAGPDRAPIDRRAQWAAQFSRARARAGNVHAEAFPFLRTSGIRRCHVYDRNEPLFYAGGRRSAPPLLSP